MRSLIPDECAASSDPKSRGSRQRSPDYRKLTNCRKPDSTAAFVRLSDPPELRCIRRARIAQVASQGWKSSGMLSSGFQFRLNDQHASPIQNELGSFRFAEIGRAHV